MIELEKYADMSIADCCHTKSYGGRASPVWNDQAGIKCSCDTECMNYVIEWFMKKIVYNTILPWSLPPPDP